MSAPTDNWCTPPEILGVVRKVAPIGLDPCSNENSLVGARYSLSGVGPGQCGLSAEWSVACPLGELVFCNPPYSRPNKELWSAKCASEGRKAGAQIILLVPADVDTGWWHENVAARADAVCFLRGRVRFWEGGKPGPHPARFPCALAYWGWRDSEFRSAMKPHGWVVGKVWF